MLRNDDWEITEQPTMTISGFPEALLHLLGAVGERVLSNLEILEFGSFTCVARQTRELTCGNVGASILRTTLGGPVTGSAVELATCAAALKKLKCRFAQECRWRGLSSQVALWKLRRLREKFPEAFMVLQEVNLPNNLAERLTEPLAFVETDEVAVSLGIATISLTLQLQCVASAFFQAGDPLANLLVSINLRVVDGTLFCNRKASADHNHSICGTGHRLACICTDAEEGTSHPLVFCSFKESYLRPCWRDPRLLASAERTNLQNVQHIDGGRLKGGYGLVWRLAFVFHRSDDDEGPDEEAEIFG